MDANLKYLGFHLKPNCYKKEYWSWLIAQIEKRLKGWSLRWLWARRLVLVKSVLEVILVFGMTMAWIPRGVLEKARSICFKFL